MFPVYLKFSDDQNNHKRKILIKIKSNNGYILLLNLILITLIGLFIPLLIQQHQINFKITRNRAAASQYREAAAAGLEYQLYFLEEKSILLDQELNLKEDLKIKIKGEETANYYYLRAFAGKDNQYISEMKVDKIDLRIINKKLYRSD